MAMGNEPVNPDKQSNDKQNEDAVAKLIALACSSRFSLVGPKENPGEASY